MLGVQPRADGYGTEWRSNAASCRNDCVARATRRYGGAVSPFGELQDEPLTRFGEHDGRVGADHANVLVAAHDALDAAQRELEGRLELWCAGKRDAGRRRAACWWENEQRGRRAGASPSLAPPRPRTARQPAPASVVGAFSSTWRSDGAVRARTAATSLEGSLTHFSAPLCPKLGQHRVFSPQPRLVVDVNVAVGAGSAALHLPGASKCASMVRCLPECHSLTVTAYGALRLSRGVGASPQPQRHPVKASPKRRQPCAQAVCQGPPQRQTAAQACPAVYSHSRMPLWQRGHGSLPLSAQSLWRPMLGRVEPPPPAGGAAAECVNLASWTVGAVVVSASSEQRGCEAFNVLDAHPRLCAAAPAPHLRANDHNNAHFLEFRPEYAASGGRGPTPGRPTTWTSSSAGTRRPGPRSGPPAGSHCATTWNAPVPRT